MDKEAVGPRWAGEGRKPMVAYSKFLCQGRQDRQLFRGIALHNLFRMSGINTTIASSEAAIGDVRIITTSTTELFLDIGKLMPWIMGHSPVSRRTGNNCIAMDI